MPRDVVTKVYTFDELSDEAKERAREWARCVLNEDFDVQVLTDTFRDICKEQFGLEAAGCQSKFTIYWSLNYCQGDGVAVYGRLDIDALCAKHAAIRAVVDQLRAAAASVDIDVESTSARSHHHHRGPMTARVETHYDYAPEEGQLSLFSSNDQIDTRVSELENELEAAVLEVLQEASYKLEKIGYDEIEYQNSDEVVDDFLRANEYEFDEDGRCV